jgi:hypothetical protein
MTKEPKSKQSAGGTARAAALDPTRRSEIAKAAARARWSKDAPSGSEVVEAPPLPPPGTGKTLDGRCGDCGTVWVVAVLPMNLSAVAKLALKACCPACGSKKVFVSTEKKKGGKS